MSSDMTNFEELSIQRKIEKILFAKKDFVFKMPKKNSPVILLYSGGLDSTCLWLTLIKKFYLKVIPVVFYYSYQDFLIKKLKFLSIDNFFKKNLKNFYHPIIFYKIKVPFSFSKINKNLLINDPAIILPNLNYITPQKIKELFGKNTTIDKKKNIVLPGIPGRLWLFSYYAFLIALKLRYKYKKEIKNIFFGYVPEDVSYNREGSLTQIRTVNLNLGLFFGNFYWQVNAPLDKENGFYFSKTDLVRIAHHHKVPITKTHSCNKFSLIHCGQCFNCLTRKKVFKDLGISDKTFYLSDYKIRFRLKISKIFHFFQRLINKLGFSLLGK